MESLGGNILMMGTWDMYPSIPDFTHALYDDREISVLASRKYLRVTQKWAVKPIYVYKRIRQTEMTDEGQSADTQLRYCKAGAERENNKLQT